METVEIKLPGQTQISAFEVKMLIAGTLYERGKLSGGQAAELAGISKRSFIELLGQYGFSVFGYSADELSNDLNRLEEWKKL